MRRLFMSVVLVVTAVSFLAVAGEKTKHMKKESAASSVTVTNTQVDVVYTPDVNKAMAAGGFKKVMDLPANGEKVRLVNKTFDGKKYTAIEYYGGGRGVVTAASKFEGSRLEEMLLVLDGKLAYPVFSDGWLKPINQGTIVGKNPNFEYGRLGKNPKTEKVADLKDGRIVLHVTQEGILPYFAVESSEDTPQLKTQEVVDYANTEGCGDKPSYVYRSNEKILKDLSLPADARIKAGKDKKEKIGDCYLFSRTLTISWNETITTKSMTSYPYED
jgi:hypothetical protein